MNIKTKPNSNEPITFLEDKIPETLDGYQVVNNVDIAMDCLQKGEQVCRYEFGNSMEPILTSGQFCLLTPINLEDVANIKVGDIVLSIVQGVANTHMVTCISHVGNHPWFQISTTQGMVVGWTQTILATAMPLPYKVIQSPKGKKKTNLLMLYLFHLFLAANTLLLYLEMHMRQP